MPHPQGDLKIDLQTPVALLLGKIKAAVVLELEPTVRDILEKFKDTCPPTEELAVISKQVDSLSKVFNSFDKRTGLFTKIPPKLEKPIEIAEISLDILAHLPLPTAVPPGIGIPLSVINTVGTIIRYTQKAIETLDNEVSGLKNLLGLISKITDPVRAQLTTLKSLLEQCIENGDLNKIEAPERSTIQPADSNTEDSYVSTNGTPYTLKIISETTTDPRVSIARRQAVALDTRGIIRLRGDYSYASSAQILLDELKFRIDNELP